MPKRKSEDQHDDENVTSTTGEVKPLTEMEPGFFGASPQPAPDQAHLARLVDEMLRDPAFDPSGAYRRRLAAYSMGLDEHGAPMRRD